MCVCVCVRVVCVRVHIRYIGLLYGPLLWPDMQSDGDGTGEGSGRDRAGVCWACSTDSVLGFETGSSPAKPR